MTQTQKILCADCAGPSAQLVVCQPDESHTCEACSWAIDPGDQMEVTVAS